jgi:hypothetical protein
VDVGSGTTTSAVAAGTEVGALVDVGSDAGSMVGIAVAFVQAVMKTKRRGRIFFIE